MNNQKETIRKFVNYINNLDHLGGFWLPNIQRPFVWSEEQIERLYDSILREYPIGTLLIWKNKSRIKHRKFIDHWHGDLNLLDFYIPVNDDAKMLVLDGQQRMQSLFIGLKGSYEGRQLYFNVKSGDVRNPDDRKYEFKFYDNAPGFPWVRFSTLVFADKRNKEFKQDIIDLKGENLTEPEDDRIDENLELVRNVFCTQDNILYQEVDSIDRPESYTEDDIVEIFIRANSGGTKLDKSDLLFSLLVSSWEDADDEMAALLEDLNRDGFDFGRDFILKTCLVLFDKGAKYAVEKFRDGDTKQKIENNWDSIEAALRDVKDFIQGKTFIQSDKILTSYLTLIPLVYFRYHYPAKWQSTSGRSEFLLRTTLVGAFSGSPDNLIDKVVRKIRETEQFDVAEVFGIIRDDGRSLELSREALFKINYSDKRVHLLFNLWYDFNYTPAYIQNEPQVDHIFPRSELKKIKTINPETGRNDLMKYKWFDRDQLANLMLLRREENGASGKTNILPKDWFADKDDAYLDLHLIPKDRTLWELSNFEAFIEARKELIADKFKYLLHNQK